VREEQSQPRDTEKVFLTHSIADNITTVQPTVNTQDYLTRQGITRGSYSHQLKHRSSSSSSSSQSHQQGTNKPISSDHQLRLWDKVTINSTIISWRDLGEQKTSCKEKILCWFSYNLRNKQINHTSASGANEKYL
jgi:uncharacterized protein YhdP